MTYEEALERLKTYKLNGLKDQEIGFTSTMEWYGFLLAVTAQAFGKTEEAVEEDVSAEPLINGSNSTIADIR